MSIAVPPVVESAYQDSNGLLSGFTISDFVMVIAVLLAPVIAVQVDKFIERGRRKKEQRLSIFKTLMSTRGRGTDPRHVEALNMIDLEFNGVTDVTDSWKAYLDHLINIPTYPTLENKSDDDRRAEKSMYSTSMESWGKQREDILTNLLHVMGTSLNYKFDKIHIKRSIYAPQAHADIETDYQIIRRSLIDLLMGKSTLLVENIPPPSTPEATESRTKDR